MGFFSGIGLNGVMAGLGATSSLIGAISAGAKEKQIREFREKKIAEMKSLYDEDRRRLQTRNTDLIRRMTGQLGDSLFSGATDAAAASVAAGLYNSTGTQAMIQRQADENRAVIAGTAADLADAEAQMVSANRQKIGNMELGYADQDMANARNDRMGSQSGFFNALSSLATMYEQNRLSKQQRTDEEKLMAGQRGRYQNLLGGNMGGTGAGGMGPLSVNPRMSMAGGNGYQGANSMFGSYGNSLFGGPKKTPYMLGAGSKNFN